MAGSLASIGGLCVGGDDVVDHQVGELARLKFNFPILLVYTVLCCASPPHACYILVILFLLDQTPLFKCETQRLSGPGYCFSASAPPFVNAAAVASLAEMRERPELLVHLRDCARGLRKRLVKSCEGILNVVSWKDSPIIHLRLDKSCVGGGRLTQKSTKEVSFTTTNLEYDEYEISFMAALKQACGMAGIAVSANRQGKMSLVKHPFPPTLRLCVNVMLSDEELDECARVVAREAKRLLKDDSLFL